VLVLIGLWRSGSSGCSSSKKVCGTRAWRSGCQFTRTNQPSWLQFSPAEPNSGGLVAVIAAVSTRPSWLIRPLA
jgi:hypothetical protein